MAGGADTMQHRVPVDRYGAHHHRGSGGAMTDTRDAAVINEALAVIDKALSEMLNRELVSTGEVADVLLDVRTLLVNTAPPSDH
jgi:hypothetical protein